MLSCYSIIKRNRNTKESTDTPLSCLKHVKRGDSTRRPTAPIHIDVTFVGDRSGSMYTMGESAKKGTRSFLEEQMKIAAAGS